jgi:hypothetical protein
MKAMASKKLGLLLIVAAIGLTGSACTNVPTGEIKVFRESVVAANTAATPMLDELSATERKSMRRLAARQKEPNFVVADAGYYADIGDAPATANLRAGHKVLDRYSDVVLGLATGAGVQNDIADVENLAAETTGLLNALAPLIPPAAAAGTFIEGATVVGKPGLKLVFDELSRREARRFIEASMQKNVVKVLTDAMIASTPEMFEAFVRDAERATTNRLVSREAQADAQKAYIDRRERVRLVLSNYVVMLQRVNTAWNEAGKAAVTNSSISVVVLSDRIAELRAAVVETRKAYADLHTN